MLLLLAACSLPSSAWHGQLALVSVDPAEVDFAGVAVGGYVEFPVDVENAGGGTAELSLVVSGPFTADRASLSVPAGSSVRIHLGYRPSGYTTDTGSLTLLGDGVDVTVPVTGEPAADSDADGVDAVEAGGTDCDDADPQVHPGASDDCYDGVDADCAGDDDDDCDHDGTPVDDDCDDTDATIHPDAADPADDVDDDCDGLVDEDALAVGALWLTELHPAFPAWIELCAGRTGVHVDGFELGGAVLGSAYVEAGGCLAVCEAAIDGCTLEAPVAVGDTVALGAAGLVLDTVARGDWADPVDETWSLDPSAAGPTTNDDVTAWCLTSGSPGVLNPSCG